MIDLTIFMEILLWELKQHNNLIIILDKKQLTKDGFYGMK